MKGTVTGYLPLEELRQGQDILQCYCENETRYRRRGIQCQDEMGKNSLIDILEMSSVNVIAFTYLSILPRQSNIINPKYHFDRFTRQLHRTRTHQ